MYHEIERKFSIFTIKHFLDVLDNSKKINSTCSKKKIRKHYRNSSKVWIEEDWKMKLNKNFSMGKYKIKIQFWWASSALHLSTSSYFICILRCRACLHCGWIDSFLSDWNNEVLLFIFIKCCGFYLSDRILWVGNCVFWLRKLRGDV